MKKLLKKYDCNSDMQIFELIISSYANGLNIHDVIFNDMDKKNKKIFIKLLHPNSSWGINLSIKNQAFFHFIELL